MSTLQLRKKAKSIIDELTPRDLRLVGEFLAFVSTRETNAATRELMAIPGFAESFARGVKDLKAGRVTPWRKVRRDV